MEETRRWNQPETGRSAKGGASGRESQRSGRAGRMTSLIVAATVVAGGATWWFLGRGPRNDGGAESDAAGAQQTALIDEVKPAKPAKDNDRKPLRFWEVDASQTNGFTRMQQRKWEKMHRPPPGYTNNAALLRKKSAYAIFDHKCENLIAAYLTLKPGEGMIGSPVLGEAFRQQFLKSLEVPIIVTKDDTPEQAQLKRDMIATKIDLKARMDAGEDICKIISDTHREVQDLARYKTMLQKEVRAAAKNPDMTMQDVDDLVKAANTLLEAKGIAPITLGPISRRIIQRRKGF